MSLLPARIQSKSPQAFKTKQGQPNNCQRKDGEPEATKVNNVEEKGGQKRFETLPSVWQGSRGRSKLDGRRRKIVVVSFSSSVLSLSPISLLSLSYLSPISLLSLLYLSPLSLSPPMFSLSPFLLHYDQAHSRTIHYVMN